MHRFATACRAGSAGAVRSLLTQNVVAVSDGGGRVITAGRIHGPGDVARCVTELVGPGADLAVEAVNGQPGVVLRDAGRVVAVVSLQVAGAKVAAVWIVLNPDKLRHWE
ncbi:RNA polymerase sigma-70 factor (ECF subfamily) [Kribbella aluminosa]|uniref:RNA polymerase sigma-70 factor (ECF subfamily) n=1 Tax=Kribbella aluminosa TaxID=416017 RepID=A0ABS4ULF4_9ACTN|nr:hypothetical protein [Kribbella aluminosa]MBP2352439.1 RNA polymerase sigma-70 factor (ECF subfamily) [Kribbella aluminosa]